jgi:hypothetical protein
MKTRVLILVLCLTFGTVIAKADGNVEMPGAINPPPETVQTYVPDIVTLLLSLFGRP